MKNLRKRLEGQLAAWIVPKEDGGNHEEAYKSLKEFCDNTNKAVGTNMKPIGVIMAMLEREFEHLLDDLVEHNKLYDIYLKIEANHGIED